MVVVGSGPGGLQISYFLRQWGIKHVVLSADPAPAGMFRKYPLFQRLISWSKPYPPAEPGSRHYAWYDWNSLLADDSRHRALVPDFMDGVSYYPTRQEMEQGLVTFARRAALQVRYGCRWETTRRTDEGFVLGTSDGDYRCKVAIFAIGMAKPWKPDSKEMPGIEHAPHYVEMRPPRQYAGKRVLVIGKRNSAFEVADAMLPWARQLILVSPRPPLLAIHSHSVAGVRARYLLPYEDHVLGGGVFVLDAAVQRIDRTADGYRVVAQGTTVPGEMVFSIDALIATTGFTAPLGDLPALGLATFGRYNIPALTPFWESTSVPGIFFAGTTTQGAVGLRKHGVPSNSGGAGGYRHNARVLAAYLARTHFGIEVPRPMLQPDEVVPYLLSEVSTAAELWNQRSYLARVVSFDRGRGIVDEGILPLQFFVDTSGPDAVAIVLETDQQGDNHPAVYVRRDGKVSEHTLPSDPLLQFERAEHQAALTSLIKDLL